MSNQLNASQMQAVNHFKGPCCVIAGPGSGKTVTITQRTQNLIQKYGVDPGNILVITFTKAAAMEMKQRFLKEMGEKSTRVTFGTFHAVFFMILKMAYHFERSNIIGEEQKYLLMREIVSYHHLEYRDENEFIGNLLGEISRIKNDRIDLKHYYSACCGQDVFRKIYEEYESRLKGSRLIDFDDMLLYTYELFDRRQDILSAWQKKYAYILVDEFQDINQIQMDIVKMLAAPQNNLFIVGDDDQSIYRFRGSKPEIMLQFPKLYPDCKTIVLDVNYRSDANITKEALRLISHNKARYEKDIQSHRPGMDGVYYMEYKNQREENLQVIKELEKQIKAGKSFSDFALLFRTNTGPRFMTEMLISYNIPFKTKDRMPNLYEHWIVRDIFAYIRIASGSRKRADFLQIMNRPKRYIGRDSLTEPEIAFDEWIKLYDEQPWIAERIEKLWFDIKQLANMSPYAAINYIRRGIDYDSYLEEYAAYRNMDKEELFDVLEELMETARGYKNYEEWIKHIQDYSKELNNQAKLRNENPNAVTIATLHSSKGLEFDTVFILDVNEGIIPYKKAVLEADIEEERRLFYVGMTRAKNRLYICSSGSFFNKEKDVSRFVKEAKEEKNKPANSL